MPGILGIAILAAVNSEGRIVKNLPTLSEALDDRGGEGWARAP